MIPLGNRGKALLVSAALAVAGIWLVANLMTSSPTAPAQQFAATPTPQTGSFLPEYKEVVTSQPAPAGIDPGDFVGFLWKTALVIVLLYLSLRGLRWLQSRNLRSSPVPISVLAAAPLEPGKRLLVVEVADRILVLATAGGSVTLLTELTALQGGPQSGFQSLLTDRVGSHVPPEQNHG
jgi:flagellar biogenesis protein FliO